MYFSLSLIYAKQWYAPPGKRHLTQIKYPARNSVVLLK